MDEEESDLAEAYTSSLEDLTFNSRAHIHTLTTIASENVPLAHVIVECIVDRILTAPAEMKVPALFALDSIMKNIREPYIDLFSATLPAVYMQIYPDAPEPTKAAMVKLLKTWPGILPQETVKMIATTIQMPVPTAGVAASAFPVVTQASSEAFSSGEISLPADKAAALRYIRDTIAKLQQKADTQRTAFGRPDAQVIQSLKELRTLEQSYVVLVGASGSSTLPATNTAGAAAGDGNLLQQLQQLAAATTAPAGKPLEKAAAAAADAHEPRSGTSLLRGLGGTDNNFSLRNADRSSSSSRGGSGGGHSRPPLLPEVSAPHAFDWPDGEISLQRLKSRDLKPILILYNERPVVCSQCGLRFVEQSSLTVHLDWHFEENQREKKKGSSTSSRQWYLTEEEWCNNSSNVNTKKTPFELEKERQKELEQEQAQENATVLADESQKVCIVCGEEFEEVWSDSHDAWCFKGAVIDEERGEEGSSVIVHYKCTMARQRKLAEELAQKEIEREEEEEKKKQKEIEQKEMEQELQALEEELKVKAQQGESDNDKALKRPREEGAENEDVSAQEDEKDNAKKRKT